MKRRHASRRTRSQARPADDRLRLAHDPDPDNTPLGRARAAVERGDLAQARAILAATADEDGAARNNLAAVHLLQGDAAQALAVLQPNLGPAADLQPYARALAARCLVALGREADARSHLEQAIADFDAGLRALPVPTPVPWREYVVALLVAAGAIGDDALTWDLHQRLFQIYGHSQVHYLGGVAAFNRRRWTAAGRAWSRIMDNSWWSIETYVDLLPLLENGSVPPYRLTYEMPDFSHWLEKSEDAPFLRFIRLADTPPTDLQDADRQFAQDTAAEPHRWTLMLDLAFGRLMDVPEATRQHLTQALARFGGDRGEALAQALFASDSIPADLKMAAASGLLQCGRIANGTEVEMLIEGKLTKLRISGSTIVLSDDLMDQRYDEAIAARDRGDLALARSILAPLADFEGTMHAPSMMAYANLLRANGEYGPARRLLEFLAGATPDNTATLLNLASLELQVGNPAEARALLKRMHEPKKLDPSQRPVYERLLREVELADRRAEALATWGEDLIDESFVEHPVRPDATLSQSLTLLPVHWLRSAAALHGLQYEGLARKEVHSALLKALRNDPAAAVRRAVDTDPQGHLPDLLSYLGVHGGWRLKEDVVRLFGSDALDEIVSSGSRAHSTLGHARLACVNFQGTATVDGVAQVIVGIPAELREVCDEVGRFASDVRPTSAWQRPK